MDAIVEQFILSRFLIDSDSRFWQSMGYRFAATFDLCSIVID